MARRGAGQKASAGLQVTIAFPLVRGTEELGFEPSKPDSQLKQIQHLESSRTATGGGNPYGHCVWSCNMAKRNGEDWAEEEGWQKEALDEAVFGFTETINNFCWNKLLPSFAKKHLADWVCSASQDSDDRDNTAGRDCATDPCLKDKSCEECCSDDKNIPRGTEEGDKKRPWGHRCKGRYLDQMPPNRRHVDPPKDW